MFIIGSISGNSTSEDIYAKLVGSVLCRIFYFCFLKWSSRMNKNNGKPNAKATQRVKKRYNQILFIFSRSPSTSMKKVPAIAPVQKSNVKLFA